MQNNFMDVTNQSLSFSLTDTMASHLQNNYNESQYKPNLK